MDVKQFRLLFAVSSLSVGGAERVISDLANTLAEKGSQVAVLTMAGKVADHYRLLPVVERIALDLLWDSPSAWHSVPSNLKRSLMLRRAVMAFRPTAVVSFIEQMNVRILAALLGTRVPVIVSERTDPREHLVGRGWNFARRRLYPLAHRVVVQTESVADWVRGFVPAHKVCVIPNMVRALLPVPGWGERHNKEILAVGRLGREKGFDLLLRAYAAAGLLTRGIRLTIIGEGPERAALEELAGQLGIMTGVSMPGIVRDPERLMARCSLFVLPSRYEGFPNVLLEAMSMGCAVVAADCRSGPREIIFDGENGLLVPPEDVEALAKALSRLMDEAALRQSLGNRAEDVRRRYAREPIVLRWEELFSSSL